MNAIIDVQSILFAMLDLTSFSRMFCLSKELSGSINASTRSIFSYAKHATQRRDRAHLRLISELLRNMSTQSHMYQLSCATSETLRNQVGYIRAQRDLLEDQLRESTQRLETTRRRLQRAAEEAAHWKRLYLNVLNH